MPEFVGLVGPGLLYGLAAPACPVGMGAMMWFMMRGGRTNQQLMNQQQMGTGPAPDPAKEAELASMRAEIDQLKAAQAERFGEPTIERR